MDYKFQNASSATLLLSAPEIHFRRSLLPKQIVKVSEDVYNELQYDPGFNELLTLGVIVEIKDEEPKLPVEVAIEKAHEEIPENDETSGKFLVLNVDEVTELLKKKTIAQFTKAIQKASPATKETIAEKAIEFRMVEPAYVSLIKKYCGVDVIKQVAERNSEVK